MSLLLLDSADVIQMVLHVLVGLQMIFQCYWILLLLHLLLNLLLDPKESTSNNICSTSESNNILIPQHLDPTKQMLLLFWIQLVLDADAFVSKCCGTQILLHIVVECCCFQMMFCMYC